VSADRREQVRDQVVAADLAAGDAESLGDGVFLVRVQHRGSPVLRERGPSRYSDFATKAGLIRNLVAIVNHLANGRLKVARNWSASTQSKSSGAGQFRVMQRTGRMNDLEIVQEISPNNRL
jgi:hypothetical protein